MAIEVTTAAAPASGGGRGGDPLGTLIVVGGLGAAGYYGYRWWQREQVKAALLAEAERLKAGGMSTKDAITNAAAGACVAAAGALHLPIGQAGPLCKGAAILAIKGAELTVKGAKIAGKAIGKAGKAIGKGTKAVVYTAPKKLISKVVPKPVKKVVKKVLCLGFCGLEGADAYEMALAGASPLARRRVGRRSPVLVPAGRPPVRAARRSPVGRAPGRRRGGVAYYASLLGR